jgi:hypothetical protein
MSDGDLADVEERARVLAAASAKVAAAKEAGALVGGGAGASTGAAEEGCALRRQNGTAELGFDEGLPPGWDADVFAALPAGVQAEQVAQFKAQVRAEAAARDAESPFVSSDADGAALKAAALQPLLATPPPARTAPALPDARHRRSSSRPLRGAPAPPTPLAPGLASVLDPGPLTPLKAVAALPIAASDAEGGAGGQRGGALRSVAELEEWMRALPRARLALVRAMSSVHYGRLSALPPKHRERFLQVAEKSVGGQVPTALALIESQIAQLMRGHALHAEVARSLREIRSSGSYPRKSGRGDRGRPQSGIFGRLFRGNANKELAERFATYHESLVAEITLREDQCIACAALIKTSAKRWEMDQHLLLSWGFPEQLMLFERRHLEWQQLLNHHGRSLQRAAALLKERADEVRGLQETVVKVPRGVKFDWADEYFRRPRILANEDPEIQVLNRVCSRLELKLSTSCDACFELRPRLQMRSYDERRHEVASALERAIAGAERAEAQGDAWSWVGENADVYTDFFRFVVDRRYPQGALLFEWLHRTTAAKLAAQQKGVDDELAMHARASKVPMFTSFFAEMLMYDFGLFDPRVLAAAQQAAASRLLARAEQQEQQQEQQEEPNPEQSANGPVPTAPSGASLPGTPVGSPQRAQRQSNVLAEFVSRNIKYADEEKWKATLNQLTECVVYSLPAVQTLCLDPIKMLTETAALDEKWRAQVAWARLLSPAEIGADRRYFASEEEFHWRLDAEAEATEGSAAATALRPYATAVAEIATFETSLVPGQMLHALMRAVNSIYVTASANKDLGVRAAARAAAKEARRAERAVLHEESSDEQGADSATGSDDDPDGADGRAAATEEAEDEAAQPTAKPSSRIKHALGADDLFPIMLFAALHSGVANMNQALQIAETFGVAPAGGIGEPAYYLCTLSAAVNYACEMEEGQPLA